MSKSIIHLLDDQTANKIAAGEVVDRPSSVVKELVENAIDAGSTKIEVEVAEGGVSFIRVSDNGRGMSAADAELSILRHATSKIKVADDLFQINSLGFRGEALPSIAAVSKFTLTTRLHDETLATYVEVTGGVVTDVREAGSHVGTTVTVTDLFFNVPARKKFLKSTSTESSHINDIIGKLALSHPGIAFKLLNNSRLILSTPGKNDLLEVMASLYGAKVTPELIPISFDNNEISVTGYIGKPTILKSSRQWQTFIVNSRVVSSRMLSKAVDNGYHSLLPKSGYPMSVISISLLASALDVNVHPQKQEVKFSDEQAVFRAVYRAITGALTEATAPAQIAASVAPVYTVQSSTSSSVPHSTLHGGVQYENEWRPGLKKYEPKLWSDSQINFMAVKEQLSRAESTYSPTNYEAPAQDKTDHDNENLGNEFTLHPLGQVASCYIIAQNKEGLFIIDQHAAHERILYDRLGQATGRIPAQQLLVPLFLDMDDSDIELINSNAQALYELGFSIEEAGPRTMRLLELPADIPQPDAEACIREVLMSLRNNSQPSAQSLRHTFLQMASCRAAIKAGDYLNMRQMQALIGELCSTSLPYTCPHGRPAMIRFSPQELDKMFKRT